MCMRACEALTALEITRSLDALPRARPTAKDAAGCPAGTHVRARAAANPGALLLLARRLARGARACGLADAVADGLGRAADAAGRVRGRVGGEAVCAGEAAGVAVDAGGGAVFGVVAALGRVLVDLRRI